MEWADETREQFLEMARSGKPGKEIAAHFGIPASDVSRLKAFFGIPRTARASNTPPDRTMRIVALFREGKSNADISRDVGIRIEALSSMRQAYRATLLLLDKEGERK